MKVSAADWFLLSPELFLTAAGLLILSIAVFVEKAKEEFLAFLALISVVITIGLVTFLSGLHERSAPILGGMFVLDNFAIFFKLLMLISIALTVLASIQFVGRTPYPAGEYYALLLFTGVGMLFMVSGNNLVSIYVALELMALSSYILAGYFKGEIKSTEAALKYFVLGAFSSGVLLYGLSLVYGVAGKMGLPELAKLFETQAKSNLLIVGILLILAGLLFKIAAVPFHVWTPDVYEGSPTPVTAFFSVGPKLAAYAILARIFYVAFPKFHSDWGLIVALVSAATMVFGNVAALLQTNVKRMLAYSSIAHAGYPLMGVVAGTSRGVTAMLIYLVVYSFMQLGAFAVIVLLRRQDVVGDELKDFSGLHFRSPFAAFAMLIFMLSLGGIPPTAGFMGKFWLFGAAIDAGYYWLAMIGVLNSAISLYYYVRVVVFMYIKTERAGSEPTMSPALGFALAVAVAATLILGVYPRLLFDAAEASARTLGAPIATAVR